MATIDIADFDSEFVVSENAGSTGALVAGGIVTLQSSSEGAVLNFGDTAVIDLVLGAISGLTGFIPQTVLVLDFDYQAEKVPAASPLGSAVLGVTIETEGAAQLGVLSFYDSTTETGWKNSRITDFDLENDADDALREIRLSADQNDVYGLSDPGDMVLRVRLNELTMEGFDPTNPERFWVSFVNTRERDL